MIASDLGQLATLVRERSGLVFPESRSIVIEAGVRRAMASARISSVDRYVAALDENPVLLDDLFAELAVGETYFFREPSQLHYVQHEVFPQLRQLGRGIRMWSAGCATGEEPYTLSMMLRDADLATDASVLGTDISRARLRVGQRGEYRSWSMRGVSDRVVRDHFVVRDGKYQISAAVKEPVEFRYLNLSADHFPSPALGVWGVDVILCRNVLIYFDEASVTHVATKLLDTLTEHGWLFLGASDPILSELVPCDVVITSAGLAYKRRGAARSGAVPVAADAARWGDDIGGDTGVAHAPFVFDTFRAEPDESDTTLSEFAPATVTPQASEAVAPASSFPSANSSEQTWVDRVRTLANLGRLRDAGDACATALDHYRTSVELTYLHAVLLSEAGRHADAATAARRALYLDRTLIVAHLALGGALRRTGDTAGAKRALTNAIVLLDGMAPETVVPASGGEPAARLSTAARVQLSLFEVGT